MFNRFTHEARQVVIGAVGEAERRGDPRVGTEHLLAGVALSFSGILAPLAITPQRLRELTQALDSQALAAVGVEVELGPAFEGPATKAGHLPFTQAAKDTLEGALREARALRQRHIGAGHIVLALAGLPPEDGAIRLLARAGVSPSDLRGAVLVAFRSSA